jgi:hypothetical protein
MLSKIITGVLAHYTLPPLSTLVHTYPCIPRVLAQAALTLGPGTGLRGVRGGRGGRNQTSRGGHALVHTCGGAGTVHQWGGHSVTVINSSILT